MKYVLFLCLLLSFTIADAQKGDKGKRQAPRRPPIDTTRFVLVQGGTFKMGTDKVIEKHEGPIHDVTVNSFYLLKTEVTFEEYDKFTVATKRDSAQSGAWSRGKQPVFMVSWYDAIAYCNWRSEQEKISKYYLVKGNEVKIVDTAQGYRLPTEAEWEYAARGGNQAKGTFFAGGNIIGEVGWYKDNAGDKTNPVGLKRPNELGLYDMNGNVWEWVWDIYDGGYYASSPAVDPRGPESGPYRVMRGGAWYNYGTHAQVVTRQNHQPTFRQNSVGFRIARTY